MFKLLAILMTLSALPVAAQTIPMKKNGEVVGTATFSGNRIYLRNLKGELLSTIEVTEKGSTMYDPTGKVTDFLPVQPKQN
jgi:hypothetical protein